MVLKPRRENKVAKGSEGGWGNFGQASQGWLTEKTIFESRTKSSGELAMWLPGEGCPAGAGKWEHVRGSEERRGKLSQDREQEQEAAGEEVREGGDASRPGLAGQTPACFLDEMGAAGRL